MKRILALLLGVLLIAGTVFAASSGGGGVGTARGPLNSYGGFYVSSSAASGAITAATYVILGGTTTALDLNEFTHASPNRLTYIGAATKVFDIVCSIAFTSTKSNEIARFRIAKDGTADANSEVARKLGTGSDLGALTIVHELSLATNQYMEVYATLDSSSSNTITVEKMVCLISDH